MALVLEDMRAFLQVADMGNFTRAAQVMGLSKSRVSLRVRALEKALGTHLFERSTRAVRLTSDGAQFRTSAARLIADADELLGNFAASSLVRGRLRVDLPITLARALVIPKLGEFIALHPHIELVLSTSDQRVDLLREGFDCVLRVGRLVDSTLIAKHLGSLAMVNCASPTYIQRYGMPISIADLVGHTVVDYAPQIGATPATFEYHDGVSWREQPMRSLLSVNNTDAYRAACMAGLGIVQVPRIGVQEALRAGQLIEVLPAYTCRPLPVAIVRPQARNVPKRVRLFIDWLAQLIPPYVATVAAGNQSSM